MFFRKRKQNTSTVNSQIANEAMTDIIAKTFGYTLGEVYPYGSNEIFAMTKSITNMFEIIDHSPYATSWSTEQSMFATALCYMYPFIRLNPQMIGPTYNAVYYALRKEFDPLIANTYPCYAHDTIAEYKTVFEETEELMYKVDNDLISKKEFVINFNTYVICPLVINIAALILWGSTQLTDKKIVEYVLDERNFIRIMIEEISKESLESTTVDQFIKNFVYQSLDNPDFRDIVSSYDNMTLCE